MIYRKLFLLLIFTSLSIYSSAQRQGEDYGTFIMYRNPKFPQFFTVEKFEEIKATIETKRQDHTDVRWDITEYTSVLIKSRDTIINTSTTSPVTSNESEEEE